MARKGGWLARNPAIGRTGSIEISSAADLQSHHLLLVPSTVGVGDIAPLVRARIPHSELATRGEVSLGRFSRLTGPYQLSMEDAVDAHVPMPWTVAYALKAPVEREDPPAPGLDDRDGLARAFPRGLPWREEGRALHLLVALARRLHGAVRVAGGGLISPDPDRAVDIVIHSPFWVEPETLEGVVHRVLPSASLAVEGQEWDGPTEAIYTGDTIRPLTAHDPLSPAELAALHERADSHDLAQLSGDDVLDAFAIVGDIGPGGADGAIEVLVHAGSPREPSIADQDWAVDAFVTYEVRWSCPEWEERERRQPSDAYLASRERAQPLVALVGRAVVEVTGGVVTDEDGFWLDRYTL
jgi:hypothetical protein